MPQIPLFNQSQRLEPSSPVAAVSPETARREGNATAEFGNAMFKVGNALDYAARKTKSDEEKLESTILQNTANQAMIKVQNEINAQQIDLKENPNGNDAVSRLEKAFVEAVEPILEGASSDHVRKMVQAGIGDNATAMTAKFSVDYLDRREKNLVLMRQENLNNKSHLARGSYPVAQIALSEWESDVLQDGSIPEAAKDKVIAEGKKSIAEEAIWGIVDRAKASPNTTGDVFDKAEKVLQSDMALIFNQPEKEKISKEIRSQKSEYFNSINAMKSAEEKAYTLDIGMKDDKAVYKYTQRLVEAGTDGAKMAAVVRQIYNDPELKDSSRRSLLTDRTKVSADAEDLYEAKFNEDLYTGKMNTNTLLTRLRKDQDAGVISPSKWVDLQKKVSEKRERDKNNPGLTGLVSASKDEIRAAFGADAFDFETKMYKGQSGKLLAQAESDFALKIARLHSAKDYSEDSVIRVKNSVLEKYNKTMPDLSKNLTGLETYSDLGSVNEALKAADEDRKRNGNKWDKPTQTRKTEAAQELLKQQKRLILQKSLEINVKPNTKSKVVGE